VIPAPCEWGDTRFSKGTAGQARPAAAASVAIGAADAPRAAVQGALPSLSPSAAASAVPSASPISKLTFPLKRKATWAAAAGVVALVAATYLFSNAGSGQRYVTPVGGTNTVQLTDGSQMTLNTDTQQAVKDGHSAPAVADWDGDGRWDILAGSVSGSVSLLLEDWFVSSQPRTDYRTTQTAHGTVWVFIRK
jgi:ferric-dicitrate binding protein FerR (iron transport regulator)